MKLEACMFLILVAGSFADHNDIDCWCTTCDPLNTVGMQLGDICYYVQIIEHGNFSCMSKDEDAFYQSMTNDSVLPLIVKEFQRKHSAYNVGVCSTTTNECQIFDMETMSVSGPCENMTAIAMQSKQFTTNSIKGKVLKLRPTLVKYFYFLGAGIIFLIIGIIIGIVFLSHFYERTYSKLPVTNQHP